MANCAQCGVAMTVNERGYNKRGGVAALHVDCSELEDELYWEQKWNPGSSRVIQLQKKQAALTAKKAGQAAQWP